MIAVIAAVFLICVLVWDAFHLHPPHGEFKNYAAWWLWSASNALVFSGSICVITEQTLGFPPSEHAEALLVIGIALRVICIRSGIEKLVHRL